VSQTNSRSTNGKEPSPDDFAMEISPVRSGQSNKQASRSTSTSQRSSNRSSNRSRPSRQTLFIQDDDSDNDLGFDSS
jgi:hypothetical protein